MKPYHSLFASVALLGVVACSNATAHRSPSVEQPEMPAGAVEMDYDRHLYFRVLLRDSIPARMLFDTGATNLLIDSTFYAATFGRNGHLRKAMLSGAGDGYELTTLDASGWSCRIGEESHTEQLAVVTNLRKILGDGADGLFGLPFMQGKRVELNYAGGYMRLLATDEQIGTDFTAIPCKRLDNMERIIIPLAVTLDDGYTFDGHFLMDTGMPDELSLNRATADRLKADGHLGNARRMKFEVGGIGGSRIDNYVRTQQITVGGKAINDVRITYSENVQGAMADSRFDGLVGNALFARFDVILDCVNWVIYLRPNKDFDKPQPNNFGIGFKQHDDHWVVNALLEGGNAERAGLRRGDRIELINGLRADASQRVAFDPRSEELTLTLLRRGERVTMVVRKEE